ncbi:50S ribosomal protein L2, partial [Candidatus Pacearchaeota archaeon]|nr:50S ribosomal protein L2 [Candidatus Pacearchaeota archaeon]
MGKRIIQQRRGRGTHTYRVRKKAFKHRLGYPQKLEGKGEVIKLVDSAAHTSPLAKIKWEKGTFYMPAIKNMFEGQKIKFNSKEIK